MTASSSGEPQNLAGKVAIVTGGATSIGAAIVQALHAAGASVVIADINLGAGDALARSLGGRTLFQHTDVTDDGAIAACVDRAVTQFGGLDILVNNAAVYIDNGIASDRSSWLQAFNLNVVSGVRFVNAAVPAMKRRGGGTIVNMSSIAARFGQAGRAIYPACKAAILQVTRNEAIELAPYKIRVNTVSPGWTWSAPIQRATGGDRAKADRIGADYHPLGRIGDAADVAAAIVFLCSDAAAFITGVNLPVDGGHAITGPDQGKPATWRLSQ
jgi:NAD(P)-dependent dehydrogenase (short-subunit alcohol dehydrogenase family)